MTYAAHPADFQRNIEPVRRQIDAAPQPGVLARVFNAVFETRQRRAEREVEAFLARTGHKFTDSVERELGERLFDSGWNYRR